MSIRNPYVWYSLCRNLSSRVFLTGSSRLGLGKFRYPTFYNVPLMYLNLSERQFANETNANAPKEQNAGEEQNEQNAGEEQKLSKEAESDKIVAEKEKLIEEKEATIKDLKDKYMRALAENENVRNRSKKMVDDAKLYGIQSFSKDLLEVSDILEKATSSVPQEELDKNEHLKHLFEGLTMTQTQLQKVFENHGLEKVDPIGEKFDPNFHEALFMVPFPDKEPGTVAIVEKIGYRLHGRPLRPALVGVVQGPS